MADDDEDGNSDEVDGLADPAFVEERLDGSDSTPVASYAARGKGKGASRPNKGSRALEKATDDVSGRVQHDEVPSDDEDADENARSLVVACRKEEVDEDKD